MNRKTLKVRLMVFVLLLSQILPLAYAATISTETPTGLTAPESQYSVYWDETGVRWDNYIGTPIIRTGSGEDTWGGILFPNMSLPNAALINSANLSLYFTFELEYSSSSLPISVYGIRYDFPNEETLAVADRGSPITAAVTNVELNNITANQWVNIDVTDQIQEIVNMNQWTLNDSIGFMIVGAAQDTARIYQSNIGINVPQLNVTYNETPFEGESGEYVGQYRNHTIWKLVQDQFSGFIRNGQELYHYDYEAPVGWDVYDLPFSTYTATASASQRGIQIGNKLYVIGYNASRVDLWYANLTDLSSWSLVMGIRSGYVFKDFAIDYIPDEYMIYCFTQDTYGSSHYKTYNISSGAVGSLTQYVWTGAYTGTGLDTCYDNTTKAIWVATASPDTTGSARHLYVHRFNGSTGTQIIKMNAPYGTNLDNAAIHVYNEYVWAFGSDAGVWVERHVPIDLSSAWSASATVFALGAKSVYMETMIDDGRLVFLCSDSSGDQMKDYTTYDSLFTKSAYGTTANYTGYDLLDIVSMPYYGAETIIFERNGAELFWMHDPDLLTAGSGYGYPLYGDPNYWSYFRDNDLQVSSVDLSSVGSGGAGAEEYYILDTNGTQLNITCLESATTLEEAQACLDAYLGGGGALDDPDPPGWISWDDAFTRPKMRMYLFILGWALIWIPIWALSFVHGWSRIQYIWLMLFCIVLGLGLLWAIPTI